MIADNLHHFVLFNLATSTGWNLGRAITNILAIVILGPLPAPTPAPSHPPGSVRGHNLQPATRPLSPHFAATSHSSCAAVSRAGRPGVTAKIIMSRTAVLGGPTHTIWPSRLDHRLVSTCDRGRPPVPTLCRMGGTSPLARITAPRNASRLSHGASSPRR
jgi:hypothetical protein